MCPCTAKCLAQSQCCCVAYSVCLITTVVCSLLQGPHFEQDVTEVPHSGAVEMLVGSQTGYLGPNELYPVEEYVPPSFIPPAPSGHYPPPRAYEL